MSTTAIAVLGLQGVLFLAWAFMMFRTLFAQRRRAARRTGRMFPGPLDALREWASWWRDPDQTRDRRLLIGLTVAIIALTGAGALIGGVQ